MANEHQIACTIPIFSPVLIVFALLNNLKFKKGAHTKSGRIVMGGVQISSSARDVVKPVHRSRKIRDSTV